MLWENTGSYPLVIEIGLGLDKTLAMLFKLIHRKTKDFFFPPTFRTDPILLSDAELHC